MMSFATARSRRPDPPVRRASVTDLRARGLQAKLKVSGESDPLEREADHVAERVLLGYPLGPRGIGAAAPAPQRKCASCESAEEEGLLQLKSRSGGPRVGGATSAAAAAVAGAGRPLAHSERAFFEPRFGRDFSQVRLHDDSRAHAAAEGINARAFTLGSHIAFARGEHRPGSEAGRRLLAHELTHVVQQSAAAQSPAQPQEARAEAAPVSVRESSAEPVISRVSASDCASDCTTEDGQGVASGKFKLTVYADKEGSFLLIPFTSGVGHSWLRLEDDQGKFWTFGFWPQEGFDADQPFEDVEGCVHHPDTSHEPTSSQSYELTAEQFNAAFAEATDICATRPKYNLFGLQCTDFVKRVMAAAGQGSAGGFGLIWESPNALDSWLRTHSLVLGLSGTAATSAAGDSGQWSFGAELSYRHQFYSVLGAKLRFYGYGRTELSEPIQSLGAGAGVEFNPQKVWLPSIFVEGGGILGDLNPLAGQTDFGAGVGAAAGLRYNIDEIGVVGVEYNLVQDLVAEDPLLNRLMLSAGLRLF